jgi:hypothetical protein
MKHAVKHTGHFVETFRVPTKRPGTSEGCA